MKQSDSLIHQLLLLIINPNYSFKKEKQEK